MTDGAQFFASLAKQSTLSSAPVTAFGFSGGNPSPITVQGSVGSPNLVEAAGKEFSLIGGDISITGRTIATSGGRVNLASVASAGEVTWNTVGQPQALTLNGFSDLGNISLIQNTAIVTSAPGSGPVFIRSGKLTLSDEGLIRAQTGDEPGGSIDVTAKEVVLTRRGNFLTGTSGSGQGGDVLINADSLFSSRFANGITTSTSGVGKAGNIILNVNDITFEDFTNIRAQTAGIGNGGNILFNTRNLNSTSALIFTDSGGDGPLAGSAGNVTISGMDGPGSMADTVNLTSTSVLSTAQVGNAGIINLAARSINLNSSTLSNSVGNGSLASNVPGAIILTTPNLSVSGGTIGSVGAGQAPIGSITLNVEKANISNTVTEGLGGPAFVSASAEQGSKAGSITIQGLNGEGTLAEEINIIRSEVFTTANTGQGGSIDLLGKTVNLIESNVSATVTGGTDATRQPADINIVSNNLNIRGSSITAETAAAATAGNINLNVGSFTASNGALISSNSTGSSATAGSAGRITLQGNQGAGSSAASVDLDNSTISTTVRGGSTATTPATIDITAQSASLTNGSQISADTSGAAPAGNVAFEGTEAITVTGGSSVSSSSSGATGNAGEVSVRAPTITLADPFSSISSTTNSTGNAGSILIEGTAVEIMNGAAVNSSTSGEGNGGTVTIRASDSVTVAGSDPATGFKSVVASAAVAGTGAAGNVTIEGPTITIVDQGFVFTNNNILNGPAGAIALSGQRVAISDGGQVSSSTVSAAPGGTVTITATESVSIRGASPVQTVVSTTTFGSGDAGQVVITAPQFTMDGGDISVFSAGSSGQAGSIDINARTASLTGLATVTADSLGTGQGGQVNITATDALLVSGANTTGRSTTIASSTSGVADAGEITLRAPTMTIGDGAFVTASTSGAGRAGNVTLQAARLNIAGGAFVDSSTTTGPGQGGSVAITATESMTVSGRDSAGFPSQISTITAGTGDAGQIAITTPRLVMDAGIIKANTGSSGNAGNVTVDTGTLSLSNGALITSRGGNNATGDAGSVSLQAAGLFSSRASTVSSEGLQGAGGNVSITAGNIQLTDGTTISAQSAGLKNAGNIALTSGSNILVQDSTATTSAALASGGDITLKGNEIIRLNRAQVNAQVQGGPETKGGNIVIDPQYVIIQGGSVINASASQGGGGTINIVASQAILQEPGTRITATGGAPGLDGTINIQAPLQQLAGAIAPLPQAFAVATNLYGQRCAAQKGGQFSSFVQGARDGIPPQPGDLLQSPLVLESEASTPNLGSQFVPSQAALRLGLPGFEHIAGTHFTPFAGCRS